MNETTSHKMNKLEQVMANEALTKLELLWQNHEMSMDNMQKVCEDVDHAHNKESHYYIKSLGDNCGGHKGCDISVIVVNKENEDA